MSIAADQRVSERAVFPGTTPDGGRDAVSFYSNLKSTRGEPSFIVFQVKYVRKPLAENEPHKWLLSVLEDELPKTTGTHSERC